MTDNRNSNTSDSLPLNEQKLLDRFLNTVTELSRIDSPTGCEGDFCEKIKRLTAECDADFYEDKIGNLCFTRKNSDTLFVAHTDEPGFIVTSVNAQGRLKFEPVGGASAAALFGKRVKIGQALGVVECLPPHLLSGDELKKIPEIKDMCIDIGAKDKSDALRLTSPGDMGVFYGDLRYYGDRLLCGKGISRLFSCAALITLMTETDVKGRFLFAVKNYASFAGARAAAFSEGIKRAIVLDCAESFDYLDDRKDTACKLNGGIVIPFKNGRAMLDREMFNLLSELSEKNGIAYQLQNGEQPPSCAEAVQTSWGGIKTACLLLPVRNLCSGRESASYSDALACIKLLEQYSELLNQN